MSAKGQRHSVDEEKDGLKHASILSCDPQGINVGRAVLIWANDRSRMTVMLKTRSALRKYTNACSKSQDMSTQRPTQSCSIP
jgi:hypothetical protein